MTGAVGHPELYSSILALVGVPVVKGVLYKSAQPSGRYAFSTTSLIALSDFIQFVLSACLFYYARRAQNYNRIPTSGNTLGDCVDDEAEDEEKADPVSSSGGAYGESQGLNGLLTGLKNELDTETPYRIARLALLHAIASNTLFLLLRMADPGTVQLATTGTIVILALPTLLSAGLRSLHTHSFALILQICGVLFTQYHSGTGIIYSVQTYLILLLFMITSEMSRLQTRKISRMQTYGSIVNACVYGCSALFNLVLHIVTSVFNPEEPSIFAGYGHLTVWLIVMINVISGFLNVPDNSVLSSHVKYGISGVSTMILFAVSGALYSMDISILTFSGLLVVFMAGWNYLNLLAAENAEASPETQDVKNNKSYIGRELLDSLSPSGSRARLGVILTLIGAFSLLNSPLYWNTGSLLVDQNYPQAEHSSPVDDGTSQTVAGNLTSGVRSPFAKTLAYVRWNSFHPERIPLIQLYEPFFHTVHYSIPELKDKSQLDPSYADYVKSYDDWVDIFTPYRAIATKMKEILNDPSSDIEGLLYYHFDTWVDPMRFADMDFKDKIWFPQGSDPWYVCMNTTDRYNWLGWKEDNLSPLLEGARRVAELLPEYKFDTAEFCTGWTDIYYIPRRFFYDYARLADVYFSVPAHHEAVIPTMLNIIDNTYKNHPWETFIDRIGDCWGNCCTYNPSVEDVSWFRCGHKMEFRDEKVSLSHFNRLRTNAAMLGH